LAPGASAATSEEQRGRGACPFIVCDNDNDGLLQNAFTIITDLK